jgi:hypothetical protein
MRAVGRWVNGNRAWLPDRRCKDHALLCRALPLADGLTEQNGDGITLGRGNVAKLDVTKLLPSPFEKTLGIRQRRTVIEAEVHVGALHPDVGIVLGHLFRANAVAGDPLFGPYDLDEGLV